MDFAIGALKRALTNGNPSAKDVPLLSQEAYRAGSIALTDVLDADRELLSAQDQLNANRADEARVAVIVFRSFGGGRCFDREIGRTSLPSKTPREKPKQRTLL